MLPLPIFIRDDDESYLDHVGHILSGLRNKILVPFFGAGISNPPPSNLPLSTNLIKPLINTIDICLKNTDLPKRYPGLLTAIHESLKNQKLEPILEQLTGTFGVDSLSYLDVLDGSDWNLNHELIAKITQLGYINNLITLNFDVLFERVFEKEKIEYEVIFPLSGDSWSDKAIRSPQISIIKPHGSFAPPQVNQNRRYNIAATLTQVGDRPSTNTRKILSKVFRKYPYLLIAGYSDDDWDISPLLEEFTGILKHITWIQYVNEEDVQRRIIPKMGDFEQTRSYIWLRSLESHKYTILYGDVRRLIYRTYKTLVCEKVSKTIQFPSSDNTITPNPEQYRRQPEALILSIVPLLRETEREFGKPILGWLGAKAVIRKNPKVFARYLNTLAWDKHVEGFYEESIKLRQRALRHNIRALRRKEIDELEIAKNLISLGWDYLGMSKPHMFESPSRIILFPLKFLMALRTLRMGNAIAVKFKNKRLQALTSNYVIDWLHNWASLTLLFGPKVVWVFRGLFKFISFCYERINNKYGGELDWEYFWMRHQEVKLLSGEYLEEKNFENQISKIEHFFDKTQDIGHLRNVKIYRALFKSCQNPPDFIGADKELKYAEREWGGLNATTRTGIARIILFRRFMKSMKFKEAISMWNKLVHPRIPYRTPS